MHPEACDRINYPNSRHYMPRKLAFCALKSDIDLLVCVYIQVPYLSKFSFFFIYFLYSAMLHLHEERSSDVNLEWKNS
jgi:hypothetical protein